MSYFFLVINKRKKAKLKRKVGNRSETETNERQKPLPFSLLATKFSISRKRKRKGHVTNTAIVAKLGKAKPPKLTTGECLKALVNNVSDCVEALPSTKKIKQAASSFLSSPSGKQCVSCDISATDDVGLSSDDVNALMNLEKSLGDFIFSFEKMVYEKPVDMKLNEKRLVCLVYRFLKLDLPQKLLESLEVVTFEARKYICLIISELFHLLQSEEFPEAAMLVTRYLTPRSGSIVRFLVGLYEKEHLSLLCGTMLRKCFESPIFYNEALTDDFYVMKTFFTKYMISSCFDTVSDAFATFKCILTQDVESISRFLDINYAMVCRSMNTTLLSGNYVSVRWSLEMLFDILLERQNHNFLMKYISDKKNLVQIMQLMNAESPMISLCAYKVFKIFALNPRKSMPVNNILCRNSADLITYIHCAFQEQKERAVSNDQMPDASERDNLLGVLSTLEHITPENKHVAHSVILCS